MIKPIDLLLVYYSRKTGLHLKSGGFLWASCSNVKFIQAKARTCPSQVWSDILSHFFLKWRISTSMTDFQNLVHKVISPLTGITNEWMKKNKSPRVVFLLGEVYGREKDVVLLAVSMSANGLYFKWNIILIVKSEICIYKTDILLKHLLFLKAKYSIIQFWSSSFINICVHGNFEKQY